MAASPYVSPACPLRGGISLAPGRPPVMARGGGSERSMDLPARCQRPVSVSAILSSAGLAAITVTSRFSMFWRCSFQAASTRFGRDGVPRPALRILRPSWR